MLIVMRHGATPDEVQKVISVIEEMGYQAQPMPGNQRTAVGLVGNDGRVDASRLEGLPGVHEVIHVSQPYKQVSRGWKADPTIVRLPGKDDVRALFVVPISQQGGQGATAMALAAGAYNLVVFPEPSLPVEGAPIALNVVVLDKASAPGGTTAKSPPVVRLLVPWPGRPWAEVML